MWSGSDEAPRAAPQCDQAPGVGGDLVPSDQRCSLGGTQAPDGEQPAEMRVALPVLGQEYDRRAVVQGDLGARDERDAELARPDVGPDDPGDAVLVREGQRLDVVLAAGLDQLFRVRSSLQEGEIALAPEGNVGILARHLPQAHRSKHFATKGIRHTNGSIVYSTAPWRSQRRRCRS
jgi:hypothetical protein